MFTKCYRGMLASRKINPWLLLEIYEYSIRKRFCLRINSAGNKLRKMNFSSWSAELHRGLSLCIQRNKLFLGDDIYWLARDYGIRLEDIAVRFQNDPGWGGYVLFRESWHQCFWILLLCGECMYQWLCSKAGSILVPAGQSNCRVWHFLFFAPVSGITSNCLLFLM